MCNCKLRVLYVSHSAQLYGAEQSLLLLLKGLDKSRFSPVVVLPREGPLKKCILDLSIPVEIVPSIQKWLTSTSWILRPLHDVGLVPFWVRSVWTLAGLIRRYRIQLVHTNSLVVIDGALAARLAGIPHVWHAREIIAPGPPYQFILGHAATLSLINDLSDRVITISYAVRRCLDQEDDNSRFLLVYNAINLQDFEATGSRDAVRRMLRMQNGAFLVGTVAGLIPAKGYEDFIPAAAQVRKAMPNTRFVAVGDASRESYRRKVVELINQHGLEGSFLLLGFRRDVADIISALDLLVLPSRYEPFGRVLVEGMAAGKPVIGTNVGGIPEIIEDGVNGLLVAPGSPDELAQAIKKILQNPELARRIAAAGRESARARFNPQRYVNQIQQVYEELIEREGVKK
jgi:glycosyltransferase involved in cell wall biosynthesis